MSGTLRQEGRCVVSASNPTPQERLLFLALGALEQHTQDGTLSQEQAARVVHHAWDALCDDAEDALPERVGCWAEWSDWDRGQRR